MLWPGKSKQASGIATELKTERLIIRPAQESDRSQWIDVRGRNEAFLKPYEPTWPEQCLTGHFFDRRRFRLEDEWHADRTYAFLIFLRDGTLIGGININNVMRGAAQYGHLGYWLDEAAQGSGFMGEATKAVLGYAFGTLVLQRMNAATLPHNRRSRAMLEKIGFAEEGFAKAYIQINGVREDHVLYGLNVSSFRR